MKQRKTHHKSRNGCNHCKERHVKCDECGPPCHNCISRNTATTCAFNPRSGQRRIVSDLTRARSDALQKKPPLFGSAPDLSTILQLELMHRWCTSTYRGFVAIPTDDYFMQTTLPHGGLGYEFLLDGILASAALDIASSGRPDAAKYSGVAVELYNRSSATFREQLTQVTKENIGWVFVFSAIVAIINVSLMPESRHSALDIVTTMFDLQVGASILANRNYQWLLQCPYGDSIRLARTIFEDDPDSVPLDEDVARATSRLHKLVGEHLIIAGGNETVSLRDFDTSEQMYSNAVQQCHRCFIEDARDKIKGFCLAFPAMAGADYINACKQREPIALLILIHWGLLLDKLDPMAWWANGLGARLVYEVAGILLKSRTRLAKLPEYHEAVCWTVGRMQASLMATRSPHQQVTAGPSVGYVTSTNNNSTDSSGSDAGEV